MLGVAELLDPEGHPLGATGVGVVEVDLLTSVDIGMCPADHQLISDRRDLHALRSDHSSEDHLARARAHGDVPELRRGVLPEEHLLARQHGRGHPVVGDHDRRHEEDPQHPADDERDGGRDQRRAKHELQYA